MRIYLRVSTIVVCLAATATGFAREAVGETGFSFEQGGDSLLIKLDGAPLATYLFRHDKLTRPALVNVHTPGGIQVTRNFPPRLLQDRDPGYAGDEGMIHPVMHAGIWLGFGDLNGQDYWRLKAQVKHDGFVQPPQADGSRASFTVRNRYLTEDGQNEVCHNVTQYEFQRKPYGLLVFG